MTVQFILPEATSFPKERKLHDRLFLVLLYNLLCKTFKDHSSAFAASALSERNSLLQERCFPIASAKVGHFSIPCKTSPKKKCEKISFAPILPPHSMAKSAVKPIFPPLPHPSFFVPKSPFFPLFPVSNPISGDFSRDRARFLPCEVHFFLVFPRFKSDFERFFEGSLLPFSFALPFLHCVKAFPIRASLILHALHHLHLPIYSPSVPHPPPSSLLPHFLSLSSPLFHLPPQLPHERAPSRALRAYAYARTYLHVRKFSFIAFTASHTPRNPLCTNALGVKKNKKKPSQNTQSPHNQYINTKRPISSAVNFISSPR